VRVGFRLGFFGMGEPSEAEQWLYEQEYICPKRFGQASFVEVISLSRRVERPRFLTPECPKHRFFFSALSAANNSD
jgi:hypothetical protein